jgi:hypothetical protein
VIDTVMVLAVLVTGVSLTAMLRLRSWAEVLT